MTDRFFIDRDLVNKIRKGFYSALYFNRTKKILLKEKNFKKVTIQVFQKNNSILCGINEVLELFKIATGYWEKNRWVDKFKDLEIEHLEDGDAISPEEPVIHITGPYVYFCHLESLYLGILTRRTLVATNTRKVVEASREKPVIFFADRFDHFVNQTGDGYAAHVGGITTVCTEAQASFWNGKVAGTIPHALIAINDGDTTKTVLQFAKYIKDKVIALVDFNNNCIKTSLEVASELKRRLWGVRIDTAENLIDKSLIHSKNRKKYGVNPTLVKLLRKELNNHGYHWVKIFVSGGFNEEKIEYFEKNNAPVDAYGVGSALLKGNNDFTADVVLVENKRMAKYGRSYKRNIRFCK